MARIGDWCALVTSRLLRLFFVVLDLVLLSGFYGVGWRQAPSVDWSRLARRLQRLFFVSLRLVI
jgi:hypothetical protein